MKSKLAMIQVNKMLSSQTSTEPFSQLRKRIYLYLIILAILANLVGFSYSELNGFATTERRLFNLLTLLSLGTVGIQMLRSKLSLKQLERSLFAIGVFLSLSTLVYVLYIEYPNPSAANALVSLFPWLPSIYILTFFVFTLRTAIIAASAYLLTVFIVTLPHIIRTYGQTGIYEGLPSFLQFFLANIFTIVALSSFALFRAQALKQEEISQELRVLVMTDLLTNLASRRHMTDLLEVEFKRAKRYEHGFSIILIDIDRFKRINDKYGHEVGDKVLKELAQIFRDKIRASDLASRWGGEEFLLLLPETQNNDAMYVAQSLRKHIALTLDHENQPITISGGVATYQKGDRLKSLIKRADDALYEAKQNGRNQIKNQKPTKESLEEPA